MLASVLRTTHRLLSHQQATSSSTAGLLSVAAAALCRSEAWQTTSSAWSTARCFSDSQDPPAEAPSEVLEQIPGEATDSAAAAGAEPEVDTSDDEEFSYLDLAMRYPDGLPSWAVKKLNRKERGSYAEYIDDFLEEIEQYPTIPKNVPLYDIRTALPWLTDPDIEPLEAWTKIQEHYPGFLENAAQEFFKVPEEEPPVPGGKKIVQWEVQTVLHAYGEAAHPANKKVKCRVYLRDVQEQEGLSEAALQHMAKLCGPRYNPNTGVLTLTSAKTAHRERNRQHVMEMLHALIEEGKAAFPAEGRERQAQAAGPVGQMA